MNFVSRPQAREAKLVNSFGFFLNTAKTLDEFRYVLRSLSFLSIHFVSINLWAFLLAFNFIVESALLPQ
jgi:hypothetical protein